ncbi:MAG: glucose-6-phosphate dehydrogenase, partial [Parachlamydiaceae bacterium]
LYNLSKEGLLPSHFACVGFARRDKSNDDFRKEMLDGVEKYSRTKPIDQDVWRNFSEHLFYHRSEFDNDEGYKSLKVLLGELDKKFETEGNVIFYLSVPPSYFPDIVGRLNKHGLINKTKEKFTRVIIEKPFGTDLTSAIALQNNLLKHLDESQIYRIDHYLGKETVQNLLVFRFTNPIFETLWNHDHIDNVQITVAEEIGIGTRGKFWEEAGMLRDIVQNHMMQLVSLVAMEPPINLSADSIRDEKVKVVQAIRPFPLHHLEKHIVRGQYGQGIVNGEEVRAYREEDNVNRESRVETYVACKLFIDNWRWANVPFYLRAGKRLPKRVTEISITFKRAPLVLFQNPQNLLQPNVLVIRIQPDEGISLKMNCKVPGLNTMIQPVKMDFRYGSYFGSTPPEAYERLIVDCMAGDSTLFARDDEVLASWELFTPVLEKWQSERGPHFPNYEAGTWGPHSADEILKEDGREWRRL